MNHRANVGLRLLVLLVVPGVSPAAEGNSGCDSFLEAYTATWNTHDGDALAGLFTDDAALIMGNLPRIDGAQNPRVREAFGASGTISQPIDDLELDPGSDQLGGTASVDQGLRYGWSAAPNTPFARLIGVNHDIYVVIQHLNDDGWRLERRKGSHRQFKHSARKGLVTVPGKPSDDLAPGTLRVVSSNNLVGSRALP